MGKVTFVGINLSRIVRSNFDCHLVTRRCFIHIDSVVLNGSHFADEDVLEQFR